MPINPQIYVPQIQPMQLQDPMAFARNALAMEEAESSIAANQLKVNRANQLAGLIKNRTTPLTPKDLMSAGLFSEAEELAKAENALLTGQETESKVIGQEMDLSRRLLEGISALPPAEKARAYIAWHETQHQNPVLQRYFNRLGIKKADADARIQAALAQPGGIDRLIADSALGLDKSLEQVYQTMDLGGTKEVIGFPKFGGGRAETVPGSQRTVTASPNRPVTNIINQAESERAKVLGKGGAEADIAEYNTVRTAARSINKDYETVKLLQEGKPSTGITAELELGFNRLKAAAGGKPEAIEKVADTEYLEALLGSDVFNQFQQLGVGARGLDTPAEREFLRQVISGTRSLDKETLIRMAEMRAKYKREMVEDFNSRVESGELDDFFRDYGRKKQTFKLPPPPEVTVTAPGGRPLGTTAEQPVRVKSPEEARALKPGTKFITPDGREKVR